MFRIKICGITNVEDAVAAVEAGADAVGLNFYPKSPRYLVDLDRAQLIVDALPDTVIKVGLFVNAQPREVCEKSDRLQLDLIQLHGDEPPEFLAELGSRPVMRAFRLDEPSMEPVATYLDICRRLDCLPRCVLVDAHVKGEYGGTGKVADWQALRDYRERGKETAIPPLVLAGGLTPQNVAEAICTVRPAAVDTASGVESTPGRKDAAAVAAFVRAAKEAFENL